MMWVPTDLPKFALCALLHFLGFALTLRVIPSFRDMFIAARIFGVDMNKADKSVKVPEAAGVITGCIFLMLTFIMIPVTFSKWMELGADKTSFPHAEFAQLLAALLSIASMLLLGFADDVLDLRWRHKLLLPTMASLPLLIVYYVTTDRTDIVVPLFLRPWVGSNIDLGVLYYVYMGMLAVFCTNAINILAGINGLEVGQSVVIAASVAIFNLGELGGPLARYHYFSLYFLTPYLATTLPLLYYNWYPSRVFAGDTFCYFSGMTLAVVAILGHFSKTLLLFFIPQVVNFLYSVPQLFWLVPCPRHRLPKYDPTTDTVGMSKVIFKDAELKMLGRVALKVFGKLGLIELRKTIVDGSDVVWECNNLTLINFSLKVLGPMHERTLTLLLLAVQIACSCVAFVVRYPLALLFYGEVVA